MKDVLVCALVIVGAVLLALAITFVVVFLFTLGWNFVVPAVFGFSQVNMVQAFVLLLLAKALFTTNVTVKK